MILIVLIIIIIVVVVLHDLGGEVEMGLPFIRSFPLQGVSRYKGRDFDFPLES